MPSLFRILPSRFKAMVSGVEIGAKTYLHRTAVLEPRGGVIRMGRRCEIHRGVLLLAFGGSIEIGNNCSVHPGSILYGHGGLRIGDDVRIAAQAIVIPANHVFDDPRILIREQGEERRGIDIGNDVWLGARATVLDGVSIAEGCVIGAGAVVTKSTRAYGVYVGNPACWIKQRGASDVG